MIVSVENISHLRGLMCPSCASGQPLSIEGSSTFVMYDECAESHTSVDWTMDSRCTCINCSYSATIREFKDGMRAQHDRSNMVGDALGRVNRPRNVQRRTSGQRYA